MTENIQTKRERNAGSLNPKKNPAARRERGVHINGPVTRVSAVKAQRPRLRGARSKPSSLNVTAIQRAAHEANKNDPKRHAQGGAFGGVTVGRRMKLEWVAEETVRNASKGVSA